MIGWSNPNKINYNNNKKNKNKRKLKSKIINNIMYLLVIRGISHH